MLDVRKHPLFRMPERLASEKNPILKELRRAAARGSLTSDGFAVAEGFHLLDEALRSRCEIAVVIAAAPALVEVEARIPKRVKVIGVSQRTFNGLASTQTPQPVIALVRPPVWSFDQLLRNSALLLVLDGIQDPGNAGAMVRTAEAFGATGVAFLKGSVNPYNSKCLRGSAGSIFRVPILAGAEESTLTTQFKERAIRMYAALPRAKQTIDDAELTKPCAIVIGSEARGVGESLQRVSEGLRIPTCGVESLNAAVAAGVLLYEARRQRAVTHELV
jgi:RNA methyltransferase, TrmH family